MPLEWTASSARHNIAREDALYAIAHAVGSEELEMVKNYIIGSQALQIETPGQVASFVRTVALYDLPADYYQRFPAEVRALTADALLEIARRYMNPERMVAVVAGDARAIRSKLERFGSVKVVDEKGGSR